MLLMRQYAIDYGAEGIRSNGVNADRVEERASDRGPLPGTGVESRGPVEG